MGEACIRDFVIGNAYRFWNKTNTLGLMNRELFFVVPAFLEVDGVIVS